MFQTQQTTLINRPVADVFAYVVNPHNIPKWRTNTIEALEVEEPIGVGSTWTLVENQMGRRQFGQRVVQFEPDRLIVIETTSGSMRPLQRFVFEPTADGAGTSYDARLEITTYGIMRIFEPFMRGMVQKSMASYGENLKRALET